MGLPVGRKRKQTDGFTRRKEKEANRWVYLSEVYNRKGHLKGTTMDTRKFEYLETIRETIEMSDYDELDDYVEDIRDHVKNDPEFQELFGEIKSKHYGDVISLIDEFIYQDIQSEADKFLNEKELEKLGNVDNGFEEIGKIAGSGQEEITFEEFIDEDYSSVASTDEDL
jgi:hypothetical protein